MVVAAVLWLMLCPEELVAGRVALLEMDDSAMDASSAVKLPDV